MSDPALFEKAMSEHGVVHARLVPGKGPGERMLRFALGVKTYFDEPVGVFAAEAPVAAVAELLSNADIGGGGVALLVTASGDILASSPGGNAHRITSYNVCYTKLLRIRPGRCPDGWG